MIPPAKSLTTTGGDSNIGAYLVSSINPTTGVLTIDRTNAPSVQKTYTFIIEEENSGTEAPVQVKLLASGLTQ